MELLEAIYKRRAIRGFKSEEVPKDVIARILEISERAVSGRNAQPWKFHVLTGAKLEELKQSNIYDFENGTVAAAEKAHEGVYRDRQVAVGKQLFKAMNIQRGDKEKQLWWAKRGYRFFDAPVGLVISVDTDALDEKWAFFNVGTIVQTICMTALEFGLGTCVELQSVFYTEGVKKILGIGDEETLVIGIAMGYPDWEFPANHVISERAPLEDLCTWHDA